MKLKFHALVAVLFLVSASEAARAASINVATALDASNNLLTTGGALDAHWIVQEQAGGTGAAQVVVPSSADWGPTWVNDGPNSNWIARNANVTDNGPAPYTFSTTFNLTGSNLAQVSLAGSWTIDDGGTLNLNGNQIGSLSRGAWVTLNPFSVAAGSPFLNQGLNTLSITITDSDRGLEGVRLEGLVMGVAGAVPEPSTLVLGGTSLLISMGCW
jgi:hypothetical protein